jgi:RNA 2',3'-cyclic 3'-phosphodiesterase
MPARMFVALDLPAAAAGAVEAICTGLPGARWTSAGQLHLTLRFMAAVPDEDIPVLAARLCAVRPPLFEMSLRGVGVFPEAGTRKPPRVLWAGVTAAAPVQSLKAAIDQALGPDEDSARGFRPHLTLARFREPPGPALAVFLAAHAGFATLPWTVDAFILYRSRLGTGGARHEVVGRYELGA